MSNHNTRLLCHILEQTKLAPTPSIAITLDAEKAFNRVSWPFLKLCMAALNLGETYTDMVMALYSEPTARIAINGTLSDPITLGKGHQTGLPLSPHLSSY